MKEMTAEQIAAITEGDLRGDGTAKITGLNRIEHARKGELTFYSDKKFEKYFDDTSATCVIIPKDKDKSPAPGQAFILADNPYEAFARLLIYVDSQRERPRGFIHPTAVVAASAQIPDDAWIGPYCVIGERVSFGRGAYLHNNVSIYDDASIGDNFYAHAGVTICSESVIGSDCIIHPGAVIGSDGFGYLGQKDGSYRKIPQLGHVEIGDRVEIGANTTIDRSIVGATIIGDGVIIDNLCQIAHNCEIGENTAIASQSGISGSAKVGKRVRMAGQVGLAGHLSIADDVTILAQSGVASGIDRSGVYFGSPARPRLRAFRIEAAISQLPEIVADLSRLKKKSEEE
ncbi:MAG: UDP-3-O-(3-hydroxymyristoyl)glucosamine N-acyltransferase [Candidatus Kapaibacterium sp.]